MWPSDELSVNANGGTELIKRRLWESLPEHRDRVNIIFSRVRELSPDKPNILYVHDLAEDPENQHLADKIMRKRFAKIVFVSHWQQQQFHDKLGVPFEEGTVIRNCIVPIPRHEKPTDKINFIYHTTPHRGLRLLLPVFDYIWNKGWEDKIHLDVYSSFSAYGWGHRDAEFQNEFDICKNHPGITYHGFQPNEVVREALQKAHIFAYPNVWTETSCIALLEALSAGCVVVAPRNGAMPETAFEFPFWYDFTGLGEKNEIMNMQWMLFTLQSILPRVNDPGMRARLEMQKDTVNVFANWDRLVGYWKVVIEQATARASA